jgi:hypothetical protein
VPRLGARAGSFGICLFFAVVQTFGAEDAHAPLDELRVLVDKLNADNAKLKAELDQREAVIRLLTENLAIARTESELFQKKWAEAQLRAQTLGVNFADAGATQSQRQLVESVRALYLAEAERQRLVEQLNRLLAAVKTGKDVTAELKRAKELLAATEQPLLPAQAKSGPADATLETARVLDVNPKLQLVVLNVGLLHGARVGMPFLVLRGDRIIAEARVVEVRKRICGALIERVDKGVTVKTGDAAQVTKS